MLLLTAQPCLSIRWGGGFRGCFVGGESQREPGERQEALWSCGGAILLGKEIKKNIKGFPESVERSPRIKFSSSQAVR